MDEALYEQEVKKETERLIRLQTDGVEAARIIKWYHKNGIRDIRDNILIDACQELIKIVGICDEIVGI